MYIGNLITQKYLLILEHLLRKLFIYILAVILGL